MTEELNKEEELTPKKRRAVVVYMLIIFAAAFFLVTVSLFVRLRTMQEDFDSERNEVNVSYAAQESHLQEEYSEKVSNYESAMGEMERRIHATEQLALAQEAYHSGDSRSFQGYMTELEGCVDALSDEAAEIYAELETVLRGN